MNFFQSDVPEASLNRRLPVYETYRPRFDTSCMFALCIACMMLFFHREMKILSVVIAIISATAILQGATIKAHADQQLRNGTRVHAGIS